MLIFVKEIEQALGCYGKRNFPSGVLLGTEDCLPKRWNIQFIFSESIPYFKFFAPFCMYLYTHVYYTNISCVYLRRCSVWLRYWSSLMFGESTAQTLARMKQKYSDGNEWRCQNHPLGEEGCQIKGIQLYFIEEGFAQFNSVLLKSCNSTKYLYQMENIIFKYCSFMKKL